MSKFVYAEEDTEGIVIIKNGKEIPLDNKTSKENITPKE